MTIVATMAVFMSAFVVFVVAHIVLSVSLQRALADRHPSAWADHLNAFGPRPGALAGFVWSGRHRSLNDPDISRRVWRLRWLVLAIVLSMGGALFGWMPVEAVIGAVQASA
jgi:hypothetical protein